MEKKFWLVLFCLFALYFFNPAFATNLKMGMSDIKPWGYKENENTVGVFADAADLIAKEMKIEIQKLLFPISIPLEDILSSGRADFSFLITPLHYDKTPEIISYHLIELAKFNFYIFPAKGVIIEKYKDLENKKIGILRGLKFDNEFDTDPNIIKEEVTGYDNLLLKLQNKQIDGAVGSIYQFPYMAKTLSIPNSELELNKYFILSKREIWVEFSKNSKALEMRKLLTDCVQKLKLNGQFDKIMTKYFGDIKEK